MLKHSNSHLNKKLSNYCAQLWRGSACHLASATPILSPAFLKADIHNIPKWRDEVELYLEWALQSHGKRKYWCEVNVSLDSNTQMLEIECSGAYQGKVYQAQTKVWHVPKVFQSNLQDPLNCNSTTHAGV